MGGTKAHSDERETGDGRRETGGEVGAGVSSYSATVASVQWPEGLRIPYPLFYAEFS